MSDAFESASSGIPIDIKSLSHSLRYGNTQVHHQIVAKKESLNKQAKRQRAIARYNWHTVARYLKKRVVSRDITKLQEDKNKKLDVYADGAVEKLVSAIRFNLADQNFQKMATDLFDPLRFYKKPADVPTVEDAANAICERYMNRLSFDKVVKDVVPKFTDPVDNIVNFQNSHPTSNELIDQADEVFDDIAEELTESTIKKTVIEPVESKVFSQAASLYTMPQDNLILNPANDMDKLTSQFALNAIMYMPFTAGLPFVSKGCRKPLRSLGRFAYPTFDNEEPLDLERPATIDEDELNLNIEAAVNRINVDAKPTTTTTSTAPEAKKLSKFELFAFGHKEVAQAVTARDIENERISEKKKEEVQEKPRKSRRGIRGEMFYYDLSSILPGLDDGLMNMLMPIPNLVLNKCIFSRQMFVDEMAKPTNEIAKVVSEDPEQVIPEESLSFIDDEINASIKGFVADGTGITKAYEDMIDFNMKAAEQAILSTLTSMTFSRMKEVTPFLVGAANVKMHKQDEDGQSHSKPKRKQANPVFNTFE